MSYFIVKFVSCIHTTVYQDLKIYFGDLWPMYMNISAYALVLTLLLLCELYIIYKLP